MALLASVVLHASAALIVGPAPHSQALRFAAVPPPARAPAPVMESRASVMESRCSLGVPLTGRTLAAALKIRCDTTDAAYAIYWTKVNDELRVAGAHVASPQAAGFIEASKQARLDATGDGPIATVKRTGEELFVADVSTSSLKRRELALQHGVSQIAMIPFEDGVVEFGALTSAWERVPVAPSMPKRVLRKAFEELGALYAIFWSLEKDELRVTADYENPDDAKRRLQLRGDGESFVKISRDLTLDSDGDGPVATALRTNEEVVVVFANNEDYSENGCASMKRGAKAREHGICNIHFVPVVDEKSGKSGVLEYGVSTTAQLSRATLDATLKMQAESSGAAYAVYWKKEYTTGVVVGSPYVAEWHRKELAAKGKKLSYAEISQAVTYDMLGESPVAKVMRARQAQYAPDVKKVLNSERAKLAEEYLIGSSAFVPVLGGVIEFGASISRPWVNGEEDALKQIMPNEEITAALRAGATYIMYWDRDEESRTYSQAATFEIPRNRLTLKEGVETSFLRECAGIKLDADGLGPVGSCGRSASTIVVADTSTSPNFKRRELAKEWGVGKVCVQRPPPTARPPVVFHPPGALCRSDYLRPARERGARVWDRNEGQARDDVRLRVPGGVSPLPPHRLHARRLGPAPSDGEFLQVDGLDPGIGGAARAQQGPLHLRRDRDRPLPVECGGGGLPRL